MPSDLLPVIVSSLGGCGPGLAAMLVPVWHQWLPIALTLSLALLAYRLGEVSAGGAVAGVAVSLLLYAAAGPGGFAVLGAVFLVTAASSRFGRTRKRALGIAENPKGRGAAQILANLLAGSALSLAASLTGRPSALVAGIAALAEAAMDTASGEIGKGTPVKVYLITSFQRVDPGVDGGVSRAGTLAGIVAAVAIALTAVGWRLIRPGQIAIVVVAAILGGLVDSILGATLQRAGWLSNSAVNLAGTIFAALVAWAGGG
jgi:uncharacterized protein (TIGR00297 family)